MHDRTELSSTLVRDTSDQSYKANRMTRTQQPYSWRKTRAVILIVNNIIV